MCFYNIANARVYIETKSLIADVATARMRVFIYIIDIIMFYRKSCV